MAKKFGKILLGLTAAGAAGAGAYYWLKNRHNEEPEDEFDDAFEDDDFELDDDLGEVPERGYTTLTPASAKEETSEESEEKTDDAEAASQTPETDSEESDPASEEVKERTFLTAYHFLHKTKTRKNFSFLPGFSLPFLFKNCRLTHYLQLNSDQDCFLYFGSLNELFSETILLNTRCSLEES